MEGKIVKKGPYVLDMQPGTYSWCSCGQTKTEPFCDGSHERLNTGMTPVEMEIKYPKTVAWCGCRRTAKPPLCDGTHNKL
jgi:CDGSH iron-sulfur domain-containing protein 3